MINLARHIEVLLLTNDCVIVPGLGGFLAQHVSARRVEEENLFLPPSRTIGFNAHLSMNDGLLVQSYMETYDDSFPEATKRVEEEVNELIEVLRKEGEYELNGIGTLSMNINGVYSFTPNQAGALSPYLYGFSSFEMKALSDVAETEEIAPRRNVTVQPAKKNEGKAAHQSVFTIVKPEAGSDDKNKSININLKLSWIRNTVAVAAAILLFFLVPDKVENTYVNKAYYASNNQGKLFDAIKDKSLATAIISIEQPMETVNAAPAISVAPKQNVAASQNTNATAVAAPATAEATISDEKYCVVVASAVPRTSALKFVEELKSEGFKKTHLYESNNIIRVVYGSYPSKEAALNEQKKLRENKYFADSWVLKQE
ncbi:MAG: SPOR domain-containing protein [Bacteroidaceae bacterium]|nr:SPOR domain-containing protein [Bacteroidaceae bacterium]